MHCLDLSAHNTKLPLLMVSWTDLETTSQMAEDGSLDEVAAELCVERLHHKSSPHRKLFGTKIFPEANELQAWRALLLKNTSVVSQARHPHGKAALTPNWRPSVLVPLR